MDMEKVQAVFLCHKIKNQTEKWEKEYKHMIKNRNETSAAMDKALKNLEQAKARYEA